MDKKKIINFYCELIKNDADNFQIFYLNGYKFLKFTNTISIKMYLGNINSNIVNKELPFCDTINNKKFEIDSSKIGYSIIIGNKILKHFKSCDIKYIRIIEYPDTNTLNYSFKYKSMDTSFTVSNQIKLPFYINLNNKIANNNDFLNQLKSIGNVVEGYTKDQIAGVIESLFN